jgi:hypothetical protein
MNSIILLTGTSALVLSMLASVGLFVNTSSAQENMTSATNETGAMIGNQTNQTAGGNETGPLEQIQEAIGGIFGGNQSQ